MCDSRDMAWFEELHRKAQLGELAEKSIDNSLCGGKYNLDKCEFIGCRMVEFCRARKEMEENENS